MVLIALPRGQGPGPARCQALGPPRPAASYLAEAAAAVQARLTLPPHSLRDARLPSALETLLPGLQAALRLDEAEWAHSTAFCELSSLGQGAREVGWLQLQPLHDEASAAVPPPGEDGAVPRFLLAGPHSPCLDAYLRAAGAALDVPVLPTAPEEVEERCQASACHRRRHAAAALPQRIQS